MKNSRNFLTLVVIVAISFNTSAAIVTDNDGSAFVTKGEFDVLKSSFNKQIDDYNKSIDSKIDGAIAGYLAGIQITTTETLDLPLASWKAVECINGEISPEFTYPSVDLTRTRLNNLDWYATAQWIQSGYTYWNRKYTQIPDDESIRPCVEGIKEDFSDLTGAYWGGVYENWVEKISASQTSTFSQNLYALEASSAKSFNLYKAATFAGAGYNTDLSSHLTDYWKSGWSYYSAFNSYGYEDFGTGTPKSSLLEFSVITKKMDDYNHILNWEDTSTWEVYNPNFINTMRTSTKDTLNSTTWYNLGTGWTTKVRWDELKSNLINGGGCDFYVENGTVNHCDKDYRAVTDSNALIPRIGLVGSNVKATDIKQEKTVVSQVVGKKTYTSVDVNLIQGFTLLSANEEDVITWQPYFDNIASSDGVVSSTTEVCLQLSMIPFGEKVSVSDASKVLPVDVIYNDGTKMLNQTVAVTKNRSCSLKWKMPAGGGFVYAKWYPNISSTDRDNKNWEVRLNLDNCGTYQRIIAD